MKNKIKIAIIGCGGIARAAHMKQYLKLTEDYEIVAVCDITVGEGALIDCLNG